MRDKDFQGVASQVGEPAAPRNPSQQVGEREHRQRGYHRRKNTHSYRTNIIREVRNDGRRSSLNVHQKVDVVEQANSNDTRVSCQGNGAHNALESFMAKRHTNEEEEE